MKKRTLATIAAVLLIIVATAGCTSDEDDTITIRVEYSGEWSGTIGDEDGTRAVQGSGWETFEMGDPPIVAVIQKGDTSSAHLTLRILVGENVVAETSTNASRGKAALTYAGEEDD